VEAGTTLCESFFLNAKHLPEGYRNGLESMKVSIANLSWGKLETDVTLILI